MKKGILVLIIVCSSVLVLGFAFVIGAFAMVDFDFDRLSVSSEQTEVIKEVELSDDANIVIESDTDEIVVGKSDDDKAHLKYYESNEKKYIFSDENNTLSLKIDRKSFKMHFVFFGFNFEEHGIELLLPEKEYNEIMLNATTGSISVQGGITTKDISAEVTTGYIELCGAVAENVDLKATTGSINCEQVTCTTFDSECSTGSVNAEEITADSVTAKATTGGVSLSDVVAKKIYGECSTGDVEVFDIESEDITLKATTGDVEGNIIGEMKDFTIVSDTSTGDNNLPSDLSGGKYKLDVKTTTGDIEIDFLAVQQHVDIETYNKN